MMIAKSTLLIVGLRWVKASKGLETELADASRGSLSADLPIL
jgi:hypothetical protein